jgi:hypothetical protein
MKQLFLVVHPSTGGIAALFNVGIFNAATTEAAVDQAQELWHTGASLNAYALNEMELPWAYYDIY